MNTILFTNLFIEYSKLLTELNIKDKRYNIGEIFAFYQGDDNNINISTDDLIEIDIKSAFPSICNVIFNTDLYFINKLNSLTDKFEKNKYLTNYLVQLGEKNNENYLIFLNNYTKIIIFSYVLNNYQVGDILEYKKDSLLINGVKRKHQLNPNINILLKSFTFHETLYYKYFRINKNSIFFNKPDELIIKGTFKNPPSYIQSLFIDVLNNKPIDESRLISIYTDELYYSMMKDNPSFSDYYWKNKKQSVIFYDLIIPFLNLSI